MGELEFNGGSGTAVGATAANLLPTIGAVNMPVSGVPTLQDAAPPAAARGGSTHFMRFDGITQRFEVSPNLLGSSTTANWMIEAWVRPQPGGSGLGLIVAHGHGGAGHLLHYDATLDKYGWFVGGSGQKNGTVGASGIGTAWDHLALVRTGNVDYLYVNGVLAGQNAAQGTTPYANGSAIGTQYTGGATHGFTGDIDEVYFSTISGTFSASADLHMSNPADPVIVVPATPVSAGTVEVNTTGIAYLGIENAGAANTLTISAVSGLSGDTDKFTLVTALPLDILPGETGTLVFDYTPGATAASHSAVFTVTNNDAGDPNPAVTLTGTAITDPNLEVPATLAFGNVASTATTTKTVRVSNTAFSNDLNVSLALTGGDGKFSIVYPDPPTIAIPAGSYVDVEIACSPATTLGALTATLEISHNDPDRGSPVSVALTADSVPRFSEVAHYRFGENDVDLATTVDDTSDYDLTNINATPGTSYNAGFGGAGSTKGIDNALDDVYSYTGVPTELTGRTTNWGMAAWIRPEPATGSGQIGAGFGGLYMGVGNGARGGFSIFSVDGAHWGLNVGGASAPNSPVTIQGGTWTHVAAVAVDNQIRLYVNGLLAYTYSGVAYAPDDAFGSNVQHIEIGGQVANAWRTVGGVDEARIFTFVSGQFDPATDLQVTPPVDADGDGLVDSWENQYFGNGDGIVTWAELASTNGSGDADNDGFTDKAEHDAGTDPSDEDSFPATEPLAVTNIIKTGDTVTVNFKGVDGSTYHLKKSLSLAGGFPTECDSVTLSGSDTGTLQDTSATEDKAFYRVEKP